MTQVSAGITSAGGSVIKKSFGVSIAVILSLGVTAISAYASPTTLRVTAPPTEVIVGGPNGGTKSFTLDVIVAGSNSSRITAEFVDVIYGADGKKENLPSGSTPYSLSKVLTIEPFDGSFSGSQRSKFIQIKVNVVTSKIQEMFYGGFVVKAEPLTSNSPKKNQNSATSTSSGIISQINVFPYGYGAGKNSDKISAADLTYTSFTAQNRTSVIDYILPDIPGVMNSGPIEAKVNYKNSGKLPIFVSATWNFSTGGKKIASQSSARTLVRPGQSASRATITQAKVQGTDALTNVLPSFGVVEVNTTLASDIAGTTFKPVTKTSSVFIVQWKEPFFFIALGILFVWYVLRRRPAQSQVEGKRKEPSLAYLAIVALSKYFKKRIATSRARSK
jgi:hypothetical protein